jgi:hypothetical protein
MYLVFLDVAENSSARKCGKKQGKRPGTIE